MGVRADVQRKRTKECLGNCCVTIEWPAPHPVFLLVLISQEPTHSQL